MVNKPKTSKLTLQLKKRRNKKKRQLKLRHPHPKTIGQKKRSLTSPKLSSNSLPALFKDGR
jgi:hypothetical protein